MAFFYVSVVDGIRLTITADNSYNVYADGVLKGSNGDWTRAHSITIPDTAKIVAIYAHNAVTKLYIL